jgi:acyl carrier protein
MIPINGELEARIRALIVEEMLQGCDDAELTSETDLVKAGVVNSINVLRLVDFVEELYDLELMPAAIRQFTSIASIASIASTSTVNIAVIVDEKAGQRI